MHACVHIDWAGGRGGKKRNEIKERKKEINKENVEQGVRSCLRRRISIFIILFLLSHAGERKHVEVEMGWAEK